MYKFLLCHRYLTTRYIALVSVASVMIGVATMIVVNSVMSGFREKMRERLHGILSDVVVESRSMNGFEQPDQLIAALKEIAGEHIVAMTPVMELFAILTYRDLYTGQELSRPVRLVGIDPMGRAEVGDFREHLVDPANRTSPSFALQAAAVDWRRRNPHLTSDGDFHSAILGYMIATARVPGTDDEAFLIHPGQEIVITVPGAGRKPEPISDRLIVSDLFKSEMSEYDSQYVFVPIERLQEIRKTRNTANAIQIKLDDFSNAPTVVDALRNRLDPRYCEVLTWEEKQGPLLQAVKIEAAILNIILFFIIAVAGFGILAIFFMIVVEKTKDIGILKALGASNFGVMSIFLTYGFALGAVGCIAGAIAGVLFTIYINPIEQLMTAWTGYEIFPRDIYYFKDIPTLLDPWTIVWVVAGALVIAVSASVLPARRAARLRPVEALRYE